MKYLFVLCVLLVVSAGASGQQTAALTGRLQDTTEFKTVAFASVMVINPADSQLLKYTWAAENGAFTLSNLPAGRLRLLITRPGFADYEDYVDLREGEQKDIGFVNMLSKENLLKEVIVRDRLEAIRIKGDTTEFLVDSFLTNKNASVEDLMKRLPGLQVDKDGKITAHGKEVKKVLVDGEEFFGDDPTIATKNIKATQVESVQVYDKKSDQATISGVDDGIKEKTINLKLKEDAKKGYFGKASAGIGTRDRYEHDAMFNRFNRKQKFSVYGAASNTNKTGLNWEESRQYGGDENMNTYIDDDGTSFSYYSNNDGFDGVGIPRTWYTGAHYSDKKNNDKHAYSFNGSYKEMQTEGFDSNYTQYILPDTFYFNNQRTRINNFKTRASASGTYTLTYDSFTTIKLKVSGAQGTFRNNLIFNSENRNQEQALVNSNSRTSTDNGTTGNLDASLNFTRKFRKKGRALSLGLTQEYNQRNSEGILVSSTDFYSASGVNTVAFDQKKTNNTLTNHVSVNGTYTEPLGQKFFVITDYALNANNDKSTRLTLEKAGTPEYISRIDSLSNDFRYSVLANRGGLTFKYQHKKITTSAGGRIVYTDLRQNNLVNGLQQNQAFTNYFPSARFNYKIGTASAFDISYNGLTQQPTLQQIQPIVDNTNPLDLYVGNTSLVQSFSNSYNASYNMYKPLTGTSIWSNASFSHTYDAFTTSNYVDAEGRRINQTVNTDGNRNFNAGIYYYKSLKWLKLNLGNNVSTNLSRNVNFVNGLQNVNNNQQYNYGFDLGKNKEDQYYVSLRGQVGYNRSATSIRPDVITRFWIQEYQLYLQYTFPFKISAEADATYNIRQRTSEFDKNLNTVIVNASLSRKFMPKENWQVGIYGRDLLNQDLGFRRTATSNFVNENVHTVLRRYFLLKITYNFTSATAGNKEEKNEK